MEIQVNPNYNRVIDKTIYPEFEKEKEDLYRLTANALLEIINNFERTYNYKIPGNEKRKTKKVLICTVFKLRRDPYWFHLRP